MEGSDYGGHGRKAMCVKPMDKPAVDVGRHMTGMIGPQTFTRS